MKRLAKHGRGSSGVTHAAPTGVGRVSPPLDAQPLLYAASTEERSEKRTVYHLDHQRGDQSVTVGIESQLRIRKKQKKTVYSDSYFGCILYLDTLLEFLY